MKKLKALLDRYEDMMTYEKERAESLLQTNRTLDDKSLAFYLKEVYRWHDQIRHRIDSIHALLEIVNGERK